PIPICARSYAVSASSERETSMPHLPSVCVEMTTGNTPVQRWLSTKVTQCLSARPLVREPPSRSSLRGHARRKAPERSGAFSMARVDLLAHSVELDVGQCRVPEFVLNERDLVHGV